MICVATVIYLLLGKGASDALIQQMVNRQKSVARAGASLYKLFISDLSHQTSSYSNHSRIIAFDPKEVPVEFKGFMDGWNGTPVSGLILVDRQGIVRFGADRIGPTGEGIDVSEREYFNWAKTAKEGEVFIVEPFQSKIGFTTGRYVVSAVSPVFKNGQFNGALVTGFIIDEAISYYLDPLKVTNNTRVYLIDQNGVIVAGPIKKLIGVNYLDYLNKAGFAGGAVLVQKIKAVLMDTDEGSIDIALPDENKNGALTRYLIAYSPIVVGSQRMTLAVATPATDALESLTPFYFRDLGLAGLAAVGFLIIAVRISKIGGYKEGAIQEHKIHSGSTPPETLS